MGGYTIEVTETETAGEALSGLSTYANFADQDLQGNTMPAPQAGEGIGANVTGAVNAWHEVFTDIGKDIDIFGKNVKSAARVTYQIEEVVNNKFHNLAN